MVRFGLLKEEDKQELLKIEKKKIQIDPFFSLSKTMFFAEANKSH